MEDLVTEALDELASRSSVRPKIDERFLVPLIRSVIGTDANARCAVIDSMLMHGVPPDDICDFYIPEAARRLGGGWEDDSLSFAVVSVAVARLQGCLRDLVPVEDVPRGDRMGAPAVVVVSDRYHTLGSMVLTAQLRRVGISVRLLLGRTPEDACAIVSTGDYDAVLLSVAQFDDLDEVAALVNGLRLAMGATALIIIGGGALGAGADQVREKTGADLATNDLTEVISQARLASNRANAT
ncbi:cobalamin-dependent protein [Palleronia sediminis]|uniref:cobalamin-dependent protein n=1 Tax=Palleronia sediminis TaxID=2547833 RepID=UPI00145538AF|nr:cobalamin-dependent protein [Palleronia sediminis]